MSYCRWSSDSFRSDFYIYHSVNGIEVWVASRRHVLADDQVQPDYRLLLDDVKQDEFLRLHREWQKALDEAETVPIGLPYDGTHEVFDEDDPLGVVEYLRMLVKAGYNLPDGVIQDLLEGSD